MKNLMWTFALIVSLVFLAFAYYMRSETMRNAVNPRLPWVANLLRPYVPEPSEPVKVAPKAEPQPVPMISEAPPATPVPTAPPQPAVFDLTKLAANRAAWPSKVKIIKAKDFPAVVNG